jgi:hypothetical protein
VDRLLSPAPFAPIRTGIFAVAAAGVALAAAGFAVTILNPATLTLAHRISERLIH